MFGQDEVGQIYKIIIQNIESLRSTGRYNNMYYMYVHRRHTHIVFDKLIKIHFTNLY